MKRRTFIELAVGSAFAYAIGGKHHREQKEVFESLQKRLLEEIDSLRRRAVAYNQKLQEDRVKGKIGDDLQPINEHLLIPDDVLALIQDRDGAEQGEVFIQAWEARARTALDSQLTFRGDRLELVSQDEYHTFTVDGEPIAVQMAKTIPQEILVASAITRDTTLKQRCLEAIQVYCEWNARNAFTQLDENRVLLHEWRRRQHIDRLDIRNRQRVQEARKGKPIQEQNNEKDHVDRAYPMNQWGTFHNFLTGLSQIWNSLSSEERIENRKVILGFLRFWQSKRQEFAGLLARYYSNTGDRISDQAAPDDTIARPVGFASDCAVLLRKMGERDASFEFQTFGKELMECADEAFLRAKQKVNAGRADMHELVSQNTPGKTLEELTEAEAKEIRKKTLNTKDNKTNNDFASWDLPGDGVRVAIARVSLVRSVLLKQTKGNRGAHERTRTFITDQLTKAMDELEVFMGMASQNTSVLFLARDGDVTSKLNEIPSEYRVDAREILCLSSVFQSPNDKLPVRYLIAGGHESGNLEWFAAFGAIWELCSNDYWELLGRYFGRWEDPMKRLKQFKKQSEAFLNQMVDSAVRLNQNQQFTKRPEQERIRQLAALLSLCARVSGMSRQARSFGKALRINPNTHVVAPIE